MAKLSRFLLPVLLLGLGLLALKSLLSVPFYTSHDGFTHTARIAAYFDTLKDGQFPPRWAKNLNGRFGSPIFTYSYPLVYFVGALLHWGGISYETAFRAVMAAGFLLSGFGAYLWLGRRFGKWAGFVGAMFYLWVPYHFLNVYVRGAIAENLAYGFLPFAFLAIEEIYRSAKTKLWSIVLIFSVTAILSSHNLVSAITLPILFSWSVIWGTRNKDWHRWLGNILGLIAPFLLAAFIYLPDIFERNFIRFDQGISYYAGHFVAWWQLVRSPWGYGFDFPGTANDVMSFQLGLGHLLMLAIVVVFLIGKTIKDKGFLIQKENWEIWFFLALFIILIVLTVEHPASQAIWQSLPVVKTIVDFPWRLLGPMTVIMAYLVAFLVAQLKSNIIVVSLLTVSVLVANRNFLRVNEAVTYGNKAYDTYTGTSTAGSGEYTPVWHNGLQFPVNSPRIDGIDSNLVHVLANRADRLEFYLGPNTNKEIIINRFYFPETKIYFNGQRLSMGKDWEIIDGSGLIRLKVGSAGGIYRLTFSETPLRDFANKISLTTLIVIIISIL